MRLASIRALVVVLAVFLAAGPVARADSGDGRDDRLEIRRAGFCSAASSVKLRLRAEEGRIRVELEIDTRRGAPWSVVLLHERRIVFRGRLRSADTSGSFELKRIVADWFGPDAIVARAKGPGGESCRVSATV